MKESCRVVKLKLRTESTGLRLNQKRVELSTLINTHKGTYILSTELRFCSNKNTSLVFKISLYQDQLRVNMSNNQHTITYSVT